MIVNVINANLVILGGAGSGLATAVRAAEEGVKDIVLLEKMASTGGCTKMAWGIFGVESRIAKELGIDESADECFKYHMDMNSWQCNGKLARRWINQSKKMVDWLESEGVIFNDVFPFGGPKAFYHCAGSKDEKSQEGGTGLLVVKALTKRCEELGVDIRLKTAAEHLIVENGKVVGVKANDPEGELEIRAKVVVIATGSISANCELLKRFYPDKYWGEEIWVTAKTPFNQGDGLRMVEEIGGKACTYTGALHIGPMVPYHETVNYFSKRPEAIRINRNGDRFVDEGLPIKSLWGWMAGTAMDQQPGRVGYCIVSEDAIGKIAARPDLNTSFFDVRAAEVYLRKHKNDLPEEDKNNLNAWCKYVARDIDKLIADGGAVKVDSIEEAASFIGCDPGHLRETLDNYNGFCDAGYDDEFLKDPEFLYSMKEGPYYVIRIWSAIDTVLGGIQVDHNFHVLDQKTMNPIENLYAVGICGSGWTGPTYSFWGAEMSYVLTSGYEMGKQAADIILA